MVSIRLVNGATPNEGRVEVWHNGAWGTVCDDNWDMNDANVACRQLGYPYATNAYSSATHGAGSGPIYLDGISCTGTEASLDSCPHNGWGVEDCTHSEDSSLKCYPMIRLVNGATPNEGRVEVWHNGAWGTVCDENWDMNDANVACRQLGYPYATNFYGSATHGAGSGPTHIDGINCAGTEASLDSCPHNGWGVEDCTHSEDSSLKCYQSSSIRLANGPLPNEGRVEVYYNGAWGTVCDDNWDIDDGHVACRELGYPSAAQVWSSAFYGQGTGAIHLDEMACSGSEASLGACGHNGWGSHNCGHYEDSSVKCNLT
ncbi:neurotrypsin-like [Patiria miniata]|uniref:SRCR domain-containing protein n=1 Tax=Patiria miniata TaxID=46514 RepID=A0A914BIS2_PATMI|nr:neurotrypsin-like [Patiria miniata]